MKVSFNIDINDYMSADDIEDMVRDEVRYQIRDRVKETLKYVAVSDIIYSTASNIVMRQLEEQDVNLHQKMTDKVLECVDDLSLYYIFRDDDKGNKSKGQLVLDECIEEAKPEIRLKVDEIIEDKLNASWLVDEVVDAFYDKLSEQLLGKR